ncbi:MAG: DUF4010 domain-containing protein [Bdellovibrionales bacterium]|nr:DUF4010 domain-containing protein [Bdellovibrionales bacterium]
MPLSSSSKNELKAVLILVAGFGLVTLLGDLPKKIAELVLLLAALEFTSYLAAKYFGSGRAFWIVGFLGGLVSSTAVTLACAEASNKSAKSWKFRSGTALAAQLAATLEMFGIVLFAARPLATRIALPTALLAATLTAGIVWCSRSQKDSDFKIEVRSPIDAKNVLRLSLFLGTIFAGMAALQKVLGSQATGLFAFVTGLFEMHGVTLATTTLYTQSSIDADTAVINISLATVASVVAKISLAWTHGSRRFAAFMTAVLTLGSAFFALVF